MRNPHPFYSAYVRSIIAFALGAVLLSAAACSGSSYPTAPMASGAAGGESPGAGLSGYRLGAGDHVRIIVFGQKDLTGEYTVDGQGRLAFPLIGDVQAGGETGQNLAQSIEQRLSPDYLRDPKVSVEIITYRPFYIVGEVHKPGSYPFVSGMSVINAIALAGGFTYRAREDDFYVRRSSNGKKYAAGPATPIYPGDVITVRERYF